MNAQTRKQTLELKNRLQALHDEIVEIGATLRELADAEQEKYDSMPDNLQQGERGQAFEAAADDLREAADAAEEGNLDDALDALGGMDL
jgi:hypothetical protein